MRTRPTLLIVSFSPIISDARVLKQIALFRDDFAITTVGYGPQPEGSAEHLRVDTEAAIWRYPKLLVILRQFSSAYRANQAIAQAMRMLDGRVFDVAIANDVEASGVMSVVRLRQGFHADLHEYSPRLHEEDWKFRWFLSPFYAWMVRRHVTRARSVSTVGAGLAEEYRRVFGLEPIVVTNAAPYREAVPRPVGAPLRLVHSGAGLRNRCLEVTIDGVMAATTPCTLDLYLTENDPVYISELRHRAETSAGRIRVLDPVPYEQLAETLESYDLGVFVLPPITFNYRWALPNKLFDFVQARLGVVVGPSPEMARYVEQHGIGIVTSDFTSVALSDALDGLTPDHVRGWKRSADAAARELSGEIEVQKWRAAVASLMEDG